ncbi:hypothetical protein KIW84_045423 [Lathyrus oleraceus]|uniref:Uncharacterized protein n=1 Tax=Pisum sativum TaxID=3888 RepID=A0A9D4XNT0_PEA|nr:hypothetical protein KIW84_045423 [Pisum sativum]
MKFPVFRPKWRSGQFSDVQIEEVSDIQVDATCGIQASFRYSNRSGVQASFPMFRSKKFLTFRPVSGIQIEEVSDIQVNATCGIQVSFWYSDRSGIQASFRYSDRSGIQASFWYSNRSGVQFPVFIPKWHSDQFPVFRPKWHSGQFPVFRPKWRSGQFSDVQIEEDSDVQVDATYDIQASFLMFRSKKFPTFRSMQLVAFRPVSGIQTEVAFRPVSGIQIEVAFRPVFRCSDRRSFRHSGRHNLWHSGQPLGVQTDINNLISSDVQIEVISSIQTDERHSGHGYFYVTIYFGIQVNILFRETRIIEESIHVIFNDKLDLEKLKLVEKFADLKINFSESKDTDSKEKDSECKAKEFEDTTQPELVVGQTHQKKSRSITPHYEELILGDKNAPIRTRYSFKPSEETLLGLVSLIEPTSINEVLLDNEWILAM